MGAAARRGLGLSEGVTIALDAIWANKLRSFLTVLGNIIAVTSIILVVTILQGVDAEVTDLITGEGADLYSVNRMGITFSQDELLKMRNRPRLTRADARFLRQEATTIIAVVEQASGSGRVGYAAKSVDGVTIEGRSWEWALVDSTGLQAGRYFSPLETQRNRPVTILGSDVVEDLFPGLAPEAVVGRRVRIRSLHFVVIGVLESRGSTFGFSQDEVVMIPIGIFQRMFGARSSISMQVKPRSPDIVEASMDESRQLMRTRHRLRPREEDDFSITSSTTFLELYEQATAGIYGVLVGVVAMALVVGGIVIMNIMLMVVTERTREIGIRKAVGATYQQVLWQFLVEAVTLSVFGGAMGIAIGYGAAMAIARFSPLPYVFAPWSLIMALVTVIVTGVVFGIYPASRAARLDPIAALRYE